MIPIIFGIRIGITHTAMGISWNRNHYCWNHINKGTGSNTGIGSISGIRSTSGIGSTTNLCQYQPNLKVWDKNYKVIYPTTTSLVSDTKLSVLSYPLLEVEMPRSIELDPSLESEQPL